MHKAKESAARHPRHTCVYMYRAFYRASAEAFKSST
jgi:hypothetical protein